MANPNTILVLGAGASEEYGFPLGGPLMELICTNAINHSNDLGRNDLKAYAQSVVREIKRSGFPSIDEFLRDRNDRSDFVKQMICRAIFLKEDEERLVKHAWYHHFFNKWFSEAKAWYKGIQKNPKFTEQIPKLKIVTFNYDRSLEQFLSDFFSIRLNIRKWDAFEFLYKTVEIHHVYGRLLPLEHEAKSLNSKEEEVEYASGRDKGRMMTMIKDAATNIKTIREVEKMDGLPNLAAGLPEYKRAIFLGNAYHEMNMNLLGLTPGTAATIKIFGTAMMDDVPYLTVRRNHPTINFAKGISCIQMFEKVISVIDPGIVANDALNR